MLAFRLAARDLRGGVAGLRIVLACLALGVAVIAAVGSLRAGIAEGLAADGSRLLGGDLEIQTGGLPLPDTLRDWLRARGARLSDVVQMRSLLVAPSGERQLVEVKAVDAAWPLLGAPALDPARPIAAVLADHGLAADPVVLDRLGLKTGDQVRLGRASFTVRAAITAEPDRVASPAMFGPPVLIAADALAETGLVAPGAMLNRALRVVLPPGADPAAVQAALRTSFPDQGWRIRDAAGAAPGVDRFVEQTSLFMTLVGLTALLVGGIGVANGVRAWLAQRARSIAILRCLGAPGALVFRICLIQVMALSAVGVVIGVAAGAALPILAARLLAGLLPVPPVLGLFPGPLALAAGYGLLTAGAFALWPLGRAARIPGAALFRDALLPDAAHPSVWLIVATAALAALLVALTVLTSPDRRFALGFCVAALGTLAIFRLGGSALMLAARLAPRLPGAPARLGLADLARPGAATPLMLISVGLGLSTLAAVALIQGNIRAQVLDQVPDNAPSFYFIDIQPDQVDRFGAILAGLPGVREHAIVPSLRARVVAVKGVPVDQVRVSPDTQWALHGDRGLTYAADPPPGTVLVAGTWWGKDYDGPPLMSFDDGLARGWGVGIGDVITVNVLGRDIDLRIASLRRIAWRSLAMNFAMVASPGLLAAAPHTDIATVRADPAAQGGVLRAVSDALPNVTGIRVGDILAAIAGLLDRIAAALAATGSLTLISGALVLAGAVAAGQQRRIRQAVILKAVGATRGQLRTAFAVEFGALGLAAGLIAALIGTGASFAVVHFVMGGDWVFLPVTLAATLAACMAMMLAFGYIGTEAALRARAAPLLRNE